MKNICILLLFTVPVMTFGTALAANVVPNEIKMPGTQPNEVRTFERPEKCDICHSGYDEVQAYSNEPPFGWRGSAMANAGRDPIFWATVAVAEQDFDGAGDLCIRCHSVGGWMAGRSSPTDGSGLAAGDDEGVDCDSCHKATNPDNSEHLGVMNSPFIANKPNPDDPDGIEGYYGSGILSLWEGCDYLGPYDNAGAPHEWMQSQFHRGDMCGSCHDVSNPAVGDLAPGNGTQPDAPPVISSNGNLGGPVEEKAAFNNPPYAYGIVERTFSEWKSGILDDTPVSNFPNLPADLKAPGGALHIAYQSALLAGQGGDYEDGSVRRFTCQSCHMRPDIGKGSNNAGVNTRGDMPTHDLAGGNNWIWPLIKYQDQEGTLRFGGGLTAVQIAAMDAGQIRAQDQLRMAASLIVSENTVKVINLTGHKLITGFAEGRRMWLNIKWYDVTGTLLREDGKYGPLKDTHGTPITFQNPRNPGQTFTPQSIINLYDPNTRIYEAHYSLTQDWAQTLMAVNAAHYGPIVLSYDRYTGTPEYTIADLAAGNVPYGTYHESFHFVLNNYVNKDTRIPPYGMEYDVARKRNALPVPASQYGNPGTGGTYDYFDVVQLNPPPGATGARITLYYQGTSWEYIQFLWKANNGQNAFLGQEGVNMLDAWINADPSAPMVPPFVMETATWGDCITTGSPDDNCDGVDDDCDGTPDDGYTPTPSNCGTGVCRVIGQLECQGGLEVNTCIPGLATEDQETTCYDNLDNDCDGLTDASDTADCAAEAIPPPVDQDIGILDNVFDALVEADCRLCHENPGQYPVEPESVQNRHHLLVGQPVSDPTARPFPDGDTNGNYDCFSCHELVWDQNTSAFLLETFRDCLFCHQQTGESTVHHLTARAQAADCVFCHGDIVDNMDDGHVIPTYQPSLVTPSPSGGDGLPLNRRENGAGACNYCHDSGTTQEGIVVGTNKNTHHGTGFAAQGRCDWCHGFPLFCGDPLYDIRTCEGCHGFESLHNIQKDSDGDDIINPGGETPYFGHIGSNTDCNGCHGFSVVAAAPGSGPVIPFIHTADDLTMTAGTDTTLRLSGVAFTNNIDTGTEIVELASQVEVTSFDGSVTVLTPDFVSQSEIVLTFPGSLAAGSYHLRAIKGTKTSNPVVIAVAPGVAITGADCNTRTGILTIAGSGFGNKVPGSDADINVEIDGVVIAAADIISWSDARIRISVGSCPNSPAVTVNSLYDSATLGGGKDKGDKPCRGKKC